MSGAPFGAVKLKVEYDVNRLLSELEVLAAAQWAAQRTYQSVDLAEETELDWKVLALRSPDGQDDRTDPGGPGLVGYGDTRWIRGTPYMKSILDGLPTRLRTARVMSLGAQAFVDEHQDHPYGLPAGWVRLHIPLVTNENAYLLLDGQEYRWQPGSLWFGDFSRLHSVYNNGSARRIHLVIDAYVNQDLLAMFPDEFLTQVRWSETLLDRVVVPLSTAELDRLECTFSMPEAFLGGERDQLVKEGTPEQPARLRAEAGELVLEVDGEPRARLVHLGDGEFRMAGWTTERTAVIGLGGDAPRIRLRMRSGSELEEVVRPAARIDD